MANTVDSHEDGEADTYHPRDCLHCWTPELALACGGLDGAKRSHISTLVGMCVFR